MTKPQIEQGGRPVTIAEIEAFEARLGGQLPSDYREFLAAHNGGYSVPDAFRFQGSEKGSNVQAFYSISGARREDRFARIVDTYSGRVPSGMLPIAYDPGGNLICLRYQGPGTGRVYFWNHENEAPEGAAPTMENVRLIAETFAEFIEGLFEFPA